MGQNLISQTTTDGQRDAMLTVLTAFAIKFTNYVVNLTPEDIAGLAKFKAADIGALETGQTFAQHPPSAISADMTIGELNMDVALARQLILLLAAEQKADLIRTILIACLSNGRVKPDELYRVEKAKGKNPQDATSLETCGERRARGPQTPTNPARVASQSPAEPPPWARGPASFARGADHRLLNRARPSVGREATPISQETHCLRTWSCLRLTGKLMLTHIGGVVMTTNRESDVFAAISHRARRQILDLLTETERPVSVIAAHFDMSRPAVSQHLRILLDAGLLTERRQGRERRYRLVPEQLSPVRDWMAHYERFWDDHLDRLQKQLTKEAKHD